VQLAPGGEPFDRQHLVPVDLRGQDQAGVYRLSIQQNRARAALALAAPVLGAGQAQVLAQEGQKGLVGRGVDLDRPTVDGQPHRDLVNHQFLSDPFRPRPQAAADQLPDDVPSVACRSAHVVDGITFLRRDAACLRRQIFA
jgi:hypothetical protein